MKNPIQVWQLLVSFFILLGTIIYSWVQINIQIAVLETKVARYDNVIDNIEIELKKLNTSQTQILIELQNKKNR